VTTIFIVSVVRAKQTGLARKTTLEFQDRPLDFAELARREHHQQIQSLEILKIIAVAQ
jgi:hypothetical protein